jgi:hypothetical protein
MTGAAVDLPPFEKRARLTSRAFSLCGGRLGFAISLARGTEEGEPPAAILVTKSSPAYTSL